MNGSDGTHKEIYSVQYRYVPKRLWYPRLLKKSNLSWLLTTALFLSTLIRTLGPRSCTSETTSLSERSVPSQAPLTVADEVNYTKTGEVLASIAGPNFTHAAFRSYAEYSDLVAKAFKLPDIVNIDFLDAVRDVTLDGWEDEWFSAGEFDVEKWGKLKEPAIDFIYTWVNGSDQAFQATKAPYALNSTLKDQIKLSSGINRYRDWGELRYSLRSIEKFAPFRNKIQILVNDVLDPETGKVRRQTPSWLSQKSKFKKSVQVLSLSDFFAKDVRGCLPTFNSLTIENQLHHTESNVDRVFAMSDDMMLGKQHAASDFYSPLFGTTMGFKTNSYNTRNTPTEADAKRFGEKPWLIYTSWLLNRRFGERKRKGQAHFGHSLSRSLVKEAFDSFPRPGLQSACSRFRGDIQSDQNGFQIYSWYLAFHYAIERQREVLLWSYLTVRSDTDQDEHLSWKERQQVVQDLKEGMANMGTGTFRARNFYHVPSALELAGLEAPKVNTEILWTSLDGPIMIKDLDCLDFNVNDCLAHGFSYPPTGEERRSPEFSTATMFDRVARQNPTCGDCLIKILLHRVHRGLEPMMPSKEQAPVRETVMKALMKYQYNVVELDALFVMVTDAEQVESTLLHRLVKKSNRVGQLCLNDDVSTNDEKELDDMMRTMRALYEGLLPKASEWEKASSLFSVV